MTTTLTDARASGLAILHDDGGANSRYRIAEPIAAEDCWRGPLLPAATRAVSTDRVLVSRWTRRGIEPIEHTSEGTGDHHTIGINLKSTALTFRSGRMLYEGEVTPGAIHVTNPGQNARAVFRSPCDVLHLYVPQGLLVEHFQEAFGRQHNGDIILGAPHFTCDPSIERLGRALSSVEGSETFFSDIYVESISIAIVARLLERRFAIDRIPTSGKVTALPPWRLRRAIDYIEAHLAEKLTLGSIAASVGLTRMHFAAQFRLATGFTPYAYLRRRRVEFAQKLLLESDLPLVQIALACGFSTQSHFSSAFKQIVGDSPRWWRVHARIGR
ncbi:helix-turn-helix domain-containing protein [Paraburkholderia sp. RL18-085-BIA-A]|uniref:helix-turn-helix domain-containing protein n=1 Tax=Paraburkholderia sp. RL18-085-BIA-A TaxID=3031633 RepID=UPI0038B9B612